MAPVTLRKDTPRHMPRKPDLHPDPVPPPRPEGRPGTADRPDDERHRDHPEPPRPPERHLTSAWSGRRQGDPMGAA